MKLEDESSSESPLRLPFKMMVTRPFVFAICDDFSGVVVFLGAVVDPLAGCPPPRICPSGFERWVGCPGAGFAAGVMSPLSTTGQTTTPPHAYNHYAILPSRRPGIARYRCLGGRHEQNIEDCPRRRRRAGRSCSRRAVFDSRQSVPSHH